MRLFLVPLLLGLSVAPARSFPLEEAWGRGMRPRSDAAEQLGVRVRASAQRGAAALVEQARRRGKARRAIRWGAALGALLAASLAVLMLAKRRRRLEDARLRSVLDIARRREEERR